MKKILLSAFLLLISFNALAQKQNEIRIYGGITTSDISRHSKLDGDVSLDLNNTYEFGLRYLLQITQNLAIETGLNYWRGDVKINPPMNPGPNLSSRKEKLQITSIPIYANFSFLDYFFINGGPVMDFQSSDSSIDDQSGIGVGLGIGGEYSFNNFSVFINPNIRRYAVIPFEEENNHQKLTSFGVNLGLGYQF
ncbi:Outer membrane protein beta-barrel domain-containing protein [Salegentibacter echinorum]|uniref:Outer membrane protein beta-barrel domain-containing protein n=1 Tax=Salegentibacter echinorum TaxID=1073325 RepID=A0A1M5C9D5_SALEC|nr:outer membrane beta-barrel protein [Salegentibacter echinorum]SHF51384.1 Outer membrane protein beta-barrel domain-containing protein [Salegentibacter echinorum]